MFDSRDFLAKCSPFQSQEKPFLLFGLGMTHWISGSRTLITIFKVTGDEDGNDIRWKIHCRLNDYTFCNSWHVELPKI